MKQLKCEMCGGTDLIKEDSVFVCQSCGVKYSLEEAKKMMVEGTVNVQGVVKIDVSDTIKERVSTWRRIADDAFDNTNYDEAYTYYCKIVEQQVDDWFATYRKSACVAWKANLAHMRANEMAGGLVNASELLYADDEMTDSDKADGIILMVAEVYDWIQAFMRVVNEHCQKFVGGMVSAAIEYYQREIILSELMMLIMDMLTEYVYQNCTDKKYFSKLLENLYTTGMNLNSNLCATFKVKTGSRWVGSGYMDEYEVVEPDYKAISTSNKISSAIYKTKKNLFAWQEAEKKRRNASIKESVLEKHKNTEVKKLIPLAADYLKDHRYVEAEATFELIIEKAPAERVGYLGKAAAIKGNDGLFDQIFEWVIKARDKNVSDEYQLITKRVLNEKIGTSDGTLLMSACFRQELNVVNILIEMGADVHVQTKYHTTALWHICNKALPKDKELEGREIARILLEHDASVEVVNTGNIPLLNKDTDVDIKRMIKEKHPHASYFLRQAKKRKIITITALALVAVILLIILISSLVKNGQRENYIAHGEYGEVVKMDNLTEFVIPEGVTEIKDDAFEWCENLKNVIIPEGVTKIGKRAFAYCENLTSITLPNSIRSIGEEAFMYCDNLKSINIPISVTFIGSEAFYLCHAKITCEVESRPGGWAKDWNAYNTNITWGATTVGKTDGLSWKEKDSKILITSGGGGDIVIPETINGKEVTTINTEAFKGRSSLTSITIPSTITHVEYAAFQDCYKLKDVYITDLAAWCNISFDGFLSNPLYYAENLYVNGNLVTEFEIPDKVTEIKDSAFEGFNGLTSISLPDTVTSIGEYAFRGCDRLSAINIPKTVTSIGDQAFKNCDSLLSIFIPKAVTNIGYLAFDDCENLTIYCEGENQPVAWASTWNNAKCPVVWGYKEN